MTNAPASKETAEPAKKPRRATPNPRLVGPVDLPEMERLLVETAQQMAPMIKRSSSARQRLGGEKRALELGLHDLLDRKALMTRHYEALMRAFDAEEADFNDALALYSGVGPARAPAPSDD